jgi:hypothetical protein
MEAKTKNGLIAVGTTLGMLALIYYFFIKKQPTTDNGDNIPFPPKPLPFDEYSLVDKATKTKEIKEYLKTNATELQKTAYAIGLEPIWTFADTFAKASDEGVNAWYSAVKKNEPKFTFYNRTTLTNVTIDTKTGLKV